VTCMYIVRDHTRSHTATTTTHTRTHGVIRIWFRARIRIKVVGKDPPNGVFKRDITTNGGRTESGAEIRSKDDTGSKATIIISTVTRITISWIMIWSLKKLTVLTRRRRRRWWWWWGGYYIYIYIGAKNGNVIVYIASYVHTSYIKYIKKVYAYKYYNISILRVNIYI